MPVSNTLFNGTSVTKLMTVVDDHIDTKISELPGGGVNDPFGQIYSQGLTIYDDNTSSQTHRSLSISMGADSDSTISGYTAAFMTNDPIRIEGSKWIMTSLVDSFIKIDETTTNSKLIVRGENELYIDSDSISIRGGGNYQATHSNPMMTIDPTSNEIYIGDFKISRGGNGTANNKSFLDINSVDINAQSKISISNDEYIFEVHNSLMKFGLYNDPIILEQSTNGYTIDLNDGILIDKSVYQNSTRLEIGIGHQPNNNNVIALYSDANMTGVDGDGAFCGETFRIEKGDGFLILDPYDYDSDDLEAVIKTKARQNHPIKFAFVQETANMAEKKVARLGFDDGLWLYNSSGTEVAGLMQSGLSIYDSTGVDQLLYLYRNNNSKVSLTAPLDTVTLNVTHGAVDVMSISKGDIKLGTSTYPVTRLYVKNGNDTAYELIAKIAQLESRIAALESNS